MQKAAPVPTVPTRQSRNRRRLRHGSGETRSAWVMIAPLAILYALFLVLPIILTLVQSFQRTVTSGLGFGGQRIEFAGFSNYVDVLTDSRVLDGFGRVFLIGVIQVPVMLILAIAMALLFDSGVIRLRQFFQTAAFLPHAIPGVLAALVWSALYLPQVSPLLQALANIGIDIDPLSTSNVLLAVMNITTWGWTGYNMIILYAALQSIPPELTESARLDGASGFAIATRIKLPLIGPALIITLVFSIIGSLQQFADPAVLGTVTTSIDSRFTPNLAVYHLVTGEGRSDQAAALSVVIALVAFVLSGAVLRIQSRREGRAP